LVQVQEDEIDPSRGCPFAKPKEYSGHRDELFDRFVRWGTKISICAINAEAGENLDLKAVTSPEMQQMMATVLFSAGSSSEDFQQFM